MKKPKQEKPTVVLSFRTDVDIQKKVDRKAKKQKLTRAEFLESLAIAAVTETVSQPA